MKNFKLKSVRDLDVLGRTVLLRSDLNSDIVDGRVLRGERILESIKTIKFLKKKGARVVILAHQGNPGKKNFLDLEQHAKLLGRSVRFVDDVVGERAIDAIRELGDGDVLLLDNVRFVSDEFKPGKRGNVFARSILPFIDVYINDAFSVSHRNHFSIVGFSGVKEKGIGLLFEKEIRALEALGGHDSGDSKIKMRDCLFVLGGAKAESDIKLLGRGNRVLTCGLFGQVCLASLGAKFGYQDKFLKRTVLVDGGYGRFLKKLKGKLKDVETPKDFAINFEGKRWEFLLSEFPKRLRIEDIGAVTIAGYCDEIRKASAVYMKGPAGWAEDKRFSKGTVEILKAVSKCKGFSLVGGGQLAEVIAKTRGLSAKKFGHVSLSGGATLAYVAGERLVGLRALGYY